MRVQTIFILWLIIVGMAPFSGQVHAKPDDTPLLIAIDADFSTVAVEGGNAIARGVELAVADINKAGGLMGRQVQIVHKDHRGNPARGVANIKKLAELDNLIAVVGGIHTPVAIAELPYIHRHNILYLGPWAAGTPLVENDFSPNNVFRVSIRDSEAGSVLIKHAKAQGYKTVALVLERTGWGRSNLTSLKAAAAQQGVNIQKVTWINWHQTNFSADAQSIQQAKVDAVILVTNAPEGAVAINALYQTSEKPLPVIAHWGIGSGNFVKLIGMDMLAKLDISVIQTFSFLYQNNPVAAKLFKDYQQAYGETSKDSVSAVVGTAHAYDLVSMLAIAVRQAESIELNKVRHALENFPPINGAVKRYMPAFTQSRHDALWADDYFMAQFDNNGNLIPITR